MKILPAAGSLKGLLAIPGDKSISHRALILGSLAEGTLLVGNLSDGADVASTRSCLEALGISFESRPNGMLAVVGKGLNGLSAPADDLDCGNSGTTMRLLMGVLAGQAFDTVLVGDDSLSKRPMRRVADPLARMGARIELREGCAPVRIKGRGTLTSFAHRLEVPSAQVKSALLLAGLFATGETTVEDSFGTRDHTERMLSFLGSDNKVGGGTRAARVVPGVLQSGKRITVPGDPSSAAFFAAAAALVPGSEVSLQRVLFNPSRLGFYEVLREMGCAVEPVHGGVNGREPVGDIVVQASTLKGVRIEAEKIPRLVDELPLLAVLAACAEGESRFEGCGELRVKESDRLEGTRAMLASFGAKVSIDGDALIIAGGGGLKGGTVETLGDHRLAMAASVAALISEGETTLSDAACVGISFPKFFEMLEALRV